MAVGAAAPRHAGLTPAICRDRRPSRLALVSVVVVAVLASGAGAGVRATRGAQTTADEPQYLLSAMSIAEDGSLDIADELAARRWRPFHEPPLPEQTRPLPGGRRVSPHDPLLPLLLAVPVMLGGWLAAKLAMAALAGLTAGLLLWTAVARFRIRVRTAAAVVVVASASPPLAVYGSQVYPELAAAACVTAAAAALTGPLRGRGCWVLAGAVVGLPWLAIKYAPVAATLAVLGLLRLWRRGDRRPAAGLAAALVAAGLVFVVVHLVVYSGVTAYAAGDHFVGGEFTAVGSAPDYLGRSRRLLGLLVDRHFGLAAWQPAWLLIVPSVAAVAARRAAHWEIVVLPLLAGWLNATFLALTMHGYWWPGRQVVVVLPLALVAVAAWLDRGAPARRWFAVALGGLGVGSYVWLLVDGYARRITWVVDFHLVGDPWYQAWSALLPAYLSPSPRMWTLHTAWLAVLAVAGYRGWRTASPLPRGPSEDRAAPRPGSGGRRRLVLRR